MDDQALPPRVPVDPREMIAMIQARAAGLVLPAWPVFGLVGAGGPGWLSGGGEGENGTIHSLRVDYRRPGLPERVIVQTQPAGKRLPDLDAVLRQVGAHEDEGEPLDLQEHATTSDHQSPMPLPLSAQVLVADESVPARVTRDGPNSAWSVSTGDVVVIVAARNVVLDRVELQRIVDLASLKRERVSVVQDYLASQPYPPAPYRQ